LDEGGSGENSQKWMDSGTTGFADKVNVGCERTRGIKDALVVWGLNKWKNGRTVLRGGDT
jgi:hypothetical protein